ncbi:hypothetical protein L249_6294 [Ophiocordyceps polyrhachis-furcata BCC 54312]|uniref:C-8 sterol isomerase n=1 Tax=Ophiocordyceps polyrhachis-furcata BCC 54312 TaxID=1330021 RepID=A0A367L112_9HYPO|nr:hypothetical protein L249_6294 [Ophiocordyceps polyrhachis-furcata BCC 54312]
MEVSSKAKALPPKTPPPSRRRELGIVLCLLTGLLAATVYLVDSQLERFYAFDLEALHEIARRGVATYGNDSRSLVDSVVNDLALRYPDLVSRRGEWVFNNAGGAMGAMMVLHASITEYLIIFGTAVGTEGHTGRHTADDYFHILAGTQLAYVPGQFAPEVYPPASVHHLPRGAVKQYKMPDACFALEYARGWIPPMLFFGFADGLSSTLDFPTLWATTRITAREMISNLLKGKF